MYIYTYMYVYIYIYIYLDLPFAVQTGLNGEALFDSERSGALGACMADDRAFLVPAARRLPEPILTPKPQTLQRAGWSWGILELERRVTAVPD